MVSPPARSTESSGQDRPTVAPWRRTLSLGTRVALYVTASVALVIGLLTMIGVNVGERRLEDDLRETARVTAIAVADDLELRPVTTSSEAIAGALHDFMAAAPSLQSITVFRNTPAGLTILASTSSAPPSRDALIARALAQHAPVWDDPTPHVATIAVPVAHSGAAIGAVAVTVSLAPVEQFGRSVRLLALGGTLAAIAGITLMIHLLAKRIVLAPLDEISRAMRRVSNGEMSARANLARHDEMGELAVGLNQMLAELEDLHRSLNDRVERATEELRERNEQLVRSYESVLQLREAAARAEQLAAVGQTMANVAHQIGTPLNLVSGHVQLLRQESDDPAMQRRLRIIEEQVERVESSVRELLDRARPPAEPRVVDVFGLLNRLIGAMRARLAAAGVAVDTQVTRPLPTVTADETQLELALLNVVNNAVDAMPAGGTLTIRAAQAGDSVRIEIADTGSGIPPDLLPRIFDPWLTTKPRGRGTGLGLSITRDVVSSVGGTIVARSTPAAGSTFVIDLPATAAEEVPAT